MRGTGLGDVNPQGDAWDSWKTFGWKGRVLVVVVLALMVVVLLRLADRRNESTSCGAFEAMIDRVDAGEQGPFSERTLADAEAIAIRGMGQEPEFVDLAPALSVGVITARRDGTTTGFSTAVERYAVACRVDLPPSLAS